MKEHPEQSLGGNSSLYEEAQRAGREDSQLPKLQPWQEDAVKFLMNPNRPINFHFVMPRRYEDATFHAVMHYLAELEGVEVICGRCGTR